MKFIVMLLVSFCGVYCGGPLQGQQPSSPIAADASRLRAELQAIIERSTQPAVPFTDAPPLTPPDGGTAPLPADAASRLDSVLKRIELLKSVMAQPDSPEMAKPLPHDAGATPSELSPPTGVSGDSHAKHSDSPSASHSDPHPAAEHHDQSPSVPMPTGTPILPDPINTLELANSLFQTGIIPTALQTYQKIKPQQLTPNDQLWHSYFLASSHRRTQQWEAAEAQYRDLVNTRESMVAVETAQWWLQHLDQKKAAQKTIDELSKQLDIISQERRDP